VAAFERRGQAAGGARFGGRAVLAAAALVLVAVPFGLLLFLVQDKWPPLLQIDVAGRDGLHGFAVSHLGFVTVMETLSTIGRGGCTCSCLR